MKKKNDIDTIDGQEVEDRGPLEAGSKGKGWGKGEIGKRGKLEDGGEGKMGRMLDVRMLWGGEDGGEGD